MLPDKWGHRIPDFSFYSSDSVFLVLYSFVHFVYLFHHADGSSQCGSLECKFGDFESQMKTEMILVMIVFVAHNDVFL